MENRKFYIKRPVLLIVIVLLFLGLWMGYVRGDIGMSERAMREENAGYMDDDRVVTASYGNVGESMAVFLKYRKDMTDLDVNIYVKRKHNIGWFFRLGMSGNGPQRYLQQLNCEGNDEYVLLYLNSDPISHIEVEKEDGSTMTINPEMGKPFAYIMDHSWNVTVYDVDGSIVLPHEGNM